MAKEQLESDIDNLPDYLKDFINDDVIAWDELLEHFDDEESEV